MNKGKIEANKRRAWDSFLSGDLTLQSKPFRASIEISRNCDLKCIMCPRSRRPEYRVHHPEFDMTPELFQEIACEIFPHLEEAHLQGLGETVISPHWMRILELCKPFAPTTSFSIVTNLNRKDDEMWREMVGMGFKIVFSCDGATKGTFEAIRRGSCFERILANLEVVQEAMRANGGGKLHFLVTLQKLNYEEMPLFIDLAARYGAEQVGFLSVQEDVSMNPCRVLPALAKHPIRGLAALPAYVKRCAAALAKLPGRPGNLGLHDLPISRLMELKKRTLERAGMAGMAVTFTDAFFDEIGKSPAAPPLESLGCEEGIRESRRVAVHHKCFKPFSYMVVNYKGDVGPCCHLISDGSWEQMGNLRESSFDEIWNSKRYREIRKTHLAGKPDNPACRWCFSHRMDE